MFDTLGSSTSSKRGEEKSKNLEIILRQVLHDKNNEIKTLKQQLNKGSNSEESDLHINEENEQNVHQNQIKRLLYNDSKKFTKNPNEYFDIAYYKTMKEDLENANKTLMKENEILKLNYNQRVLEINELISLLKNDGQFLKKKNEIEQTLINLYQEKNFIKQEYDMLKLTLLTVQEKYQKAKNNIETLNLNYINMLKEKDDKISSMENDQVILQKTIQSIEKNNNMAGSEKENQVNKLKVELQEAYSKILNLETSFNHLKHEKENEMINFESELVNQQIRQNDQENMYKVLLEEKDKRIENLELEILILKEKTQRFAIIQEGITQEYQNMKNSLFHTQDLDVKFRAEKVGLEAQILQLRSKVNEIEKERTILIEEKERLKKIAEQHEKEINEWKFKKSIQEFENFAKNGNDEDLKKSNIELKEKLIIANAKNSDLDSRIRNILNNLNSKERELEEAYALIQNIKDETNNLNMGFSEYRNSTNQQKIKINELEANLLLSKEEINALKTENERLKLEFAELNEKIKHFEIADQSMKSNFKEKIRDLDSLQGRYSEALSTLEKEKEGRGSSYYRLSNANHYFD